MKERTLKKLEYPKIIESLAASCTSTLGRTVVEELQPVTSLYQITEAQAETSEARELLRLFPNIPLGGIRDVRASLRKASLGGVLEPSDFLALKDTLRASRKLKLFFQDLEGEFPKLQSLAADLGSFRPLEDRIGQVITADGEVADHATSELNDLRRKMRLAQQRIKEKLETMVRSTSFQKYLQENLVTVRGDRYVLPVKAEHRSSVPGMIHDQSASGATLFIEPMAVVELNNDLKRYQAAEREEVLRILRELTELVAARGMELEASLAIMGQLDFILAKGRLSHVMDAREPGINKAGRMIINKGRHPLIAGKVVPVSLTLGVDFDTLIITGPNTGGKTVSLKTVGLFSLMAQSGLHVPADEGTELTILDEIFVDIGDEQSIEQSLSTFSSHMTNIVGILSEATPRSLVLFDEIGAGTDPSEGAALAMAILEKLHAQGAKTIATTHYSELKTFALNTPRMKNASVEFDTETLRPTYRLIIGQPGRSNAFEIAARLGLKGEVVDRAREHLSSEEKEVARLIENLEETQRSAEEDRRSLENLQRELERERRELETAKAALAQREEDVLAKARDEAEFLLLEAREEADALLKELHKARMEKDKGAIAALDRSRNKVRQFQEEVRRAGAKAEPQVILHTVIRGQAVEIPKLNQKGIVLEPPNANGDVLVQAGILKLTVKLAELRPGKEAKDSKTTTGNASFGGMVSNKAQTFSPEIDLRGTTVEEASEQLDKYLDDAYLAGIGQVRIIHGKGTMALRKGVLEYLKGHHLVGECRPGGDGEGGLGVTVASIRG